MFQELRVASAGVPYLGVANIPRATMIQFKRLTSCCWIAHSGLSGHDACQESIGSAWLGPLLCGPAHSHVAHHWRDWAQELIWQGENPVVSWGKQLLYAPDSVEHQSFTPNWDIGCRADAHVVLSWPIKGKYLWNYDWLWLNGQQNMDNFISIIGTRHHDG